MDGLSEAPVIAAVMMVFLGMFVLAESLFYVAGSKA
jgi:hypothetical protein